MDCESLILAAGLGTRMKTGLPKLLHSLGGRPLLRWSVEACRHATGRDPFAAYSFDGIPAGGLHLVSAWPAYEVPDHTPGQVQPLFQLLTSGRQDLPLMAGDDVTGYPVQPGQQRPPAVPVGVDALQRSDKHGGGQVFCSRLIKDTGLGVAEDGCIVRVVDLRPGLRRTLLGPTYEICFVRLDVGSRLH